MAHTPKRPGKPLEREHLSYTQEDDAPIRYYDGQSLSRPLEMPRKKIIAALIFVVAALLLAAYLFFVVFRPFFTEENNSEKTAQNIAADVSYQIPAAVEYSLLSRDEILEKMNASGLPFIDLTDEAAAANGGLDLFRLPDGVDIVTAGALYAKGIDTLSSADAAKFLNGSWRLTLTTEGSYNLRIRYALLDSTDPSAAVFEAMSACGLDGAEVISEGVDESGNTYKTGEMETDRGVFNWRVAACPLNEVYDIEGLPSSASYVVIRLYE